MMFAATPLRVIDGNTFVALVDTKFCGICEVTLRVKGVDSFGVEDEYLLSQALSNKLQVEILDPIGRVRDNTYFANVYNEIQTTKLFDITDFLID